LLLIAIASLAQAADDGWTATWQTVQDRKAVIATVQPVRELPARARIGGTVTTLAVKEGDRIAAGDRIALVVDQKLALQMQALEARIQSQQAELEQTRLDLERAQELRRSGAGT